MTGNIIVFFITVIFGLYFLPVCFSQDSGNTSTITSSTSLEGNKVITAGEAAPEAVKEGTEEKKEEKTEEEKKAEKKKTEKKKEEEKKAKEEEEKKKEEAKEEKPPVEEDNLDNWGEDAPPERDFLPKEMPSTNVWNDDQGFVDR
ncbi:MAG: hypothetical protein PHP17_01625 [Candidatus Omnitrophica bacterium]|nr:hypothetical protein [Candidatus Omnitrophota bacterium]